MMLVLRFKRIIKNALKDDLVTYQFIRKIWLFINSIFPLSDKFKREKQISKITNYYLKLKEEEHIFIYSVCGRSSSTALQRILNSSNEVCIFGESWGVVNKLLETIYVINNEKQNTKWGTLKYTELKTLEQSFKMDKHNKFYANAFRQLDDLMLLHKAAFFDLIRPLNNTKRIGYKEVLLDNNTPFFSLKEICPNSKLIFIFRNPVKQWNSIKIKNWWNYSREVDDFLEEYLKISSIMLDYNKMQGGCLFIENNALYSPLNIEHLLKILNISKFDKELISDNVSSVMRRLDVSESETEKIKNSQAFKNYCAMSRFSQNIFNN